MSNWTALDRLFDAASGVYSACVMTPDGRTFYAYAANTVQPSASLIKVPIAMALVATSRHESSAGVDLDSVVTLHEADRVEGEGSFDSAPAGTTQTGWELITHTLRESDNTAGNLLIGMIGMDRINRWLTDAPNHFSATRLRRKFMDFAAAADGRENTTCAREMCILFTHLLGQDGRYDHLLRWLTESSSNDKLVAGVPTSVVVTHKVGDLRPLVPGVEHDAGIVYAPQGPYIAALLAAHLPEPELGVATLAEASHMIYHQMLA